MNYDSSDFAGGVPMNEPDAVRCCAPAASAYSDGIPAGYLDNPCIPAGSHNRSHKVMEHRKLEIRKVIGREILDGDHDDRKRCKTAEKEIRDIDIKGFRNRRKH